VLAAGSLGLMQACLDVGAAPMCTSASSSINRSARSKIMQGKNSPTCTRRMNAAKALVLHRRAGACDRGRNDRAKDAAGAILFASETATWLATRVHPGARRQRLQQRLSDGGACLRDAKLYEIGAGTSEIRRMLIGRETL